MKPFPRDPATRRELLIGALVALAILLTSVFFDLPYLATGLLPGLWVVLRADRRRCRMRRSPGPA